MILRPRRRRPSIEPLSRAFEPLERRQLMCAQHAASFAWTDPNDAASLARERQRIASLNGLSAPASYAALSAPAATGDAAGLPILNSNPGAPVDIYLDFDGDIGGGYHQMVSAYDTNGDPSTFDAAEASVVTQAWQLVSSYFSMFDVNVTTDTPTKPFAWTAIGNNVSGGYSYVGVFPQSLGGHPESFTTSEFARSRASGIAHEVGHNFGLQHQADFDALGKLAAEYTSGFDLQHGALMGVDYAQRVHKWFYGHPSNNVSTLQDDMATIAWRIGTVSGTDGYRTDDVGNTIATAGSMATVGVDQTRTGVVERLSDADVFSFTSTGGRYLVSANPDVESPVDLKLEILDADAKVIAAEDAAGANDAQIALNLPAGTYYARLSSHGNYDDLGKYVLNVSPLPAGSAFDSVDVGTPLRRVGGASFDSSSGVWTLKGSGLDIAGASDQFRYAFESLSGDGSITARVVGLSGGATFAKAGLMIRESLGSGSRHATLELRGDGAVEMLSRASTSGATTSTHGGAATAGVWLRLTRAGNTVTAERSADGTIWTVVDTVTIAMANDVQIGLAVSANRETLVATGTFDNVTVTGNVAAATPSDNGLPAPANLAVVPTPTGDGLSATWDAVAGAGGYVVERSGDGVNFTVVSTQSGTSYADASLPGSYRYFYRVRALLSSGDLGRSAAAVASGVNRPSAVYGITTMSIDLGTIALDWRDTVGETGFLIERARKGGQTYDVIAVLGPNVTGLIDADNEFPLGASAEYTYRITPLSDLGNGPAASVTEGTRLGTVVNRRTSASTPTSLTVTWNDLKKVETGYRIERSTGGGASWTKVADVGGDVTSFTDTGLLPFTAYNYRITATSAYSEGLAGGTVSGMTQADPTNPLQALPAGWGNLDVGNVPVAGASGFDSSAGTVDLLGGGADIGGTADQFQFAYRRFTGDGEIVARLDSIDGSDFASEAGLMFRESLAADSRFALVNYIANTSTSRLEYRSAPATTSVATGDASVSAPIWLKLVRSGSLVSGYRSADGSAWSLVGSATVAMGASIYVGLALAAHAGNTLVDATFSHLSGSAIAQSDTDPPSIPTLVVSDDTGASATDGITRDTTLLLSGTAEPGTTLTLARDHTTLASFVVAFNGVWQYAVPALGEGVYTFTATAIDSAGNASAAGTRTVVIDTTAPAASASAFDRETAHRWTVQFNDDVGPSLSAGDFAIVDRLTNASVNVVLLSYDATTHVATLGLADGARLPDGRYELRLAAGAITDLAGNDSTLGHVLPFNVMAGDLDNNGTVNFDDLLILSKHYGQSGLTYSAGNVDYDAAGFVGFSDLLILAKAYNTSLPAAAVPEVLTTTPTRKRTATFSTLAI